MRIFKIIISFDADHYPECTDKDIMNYISKEAAPLVVQAYSAIPSYLNTTVEVLNSVVVDEIPVENKESEG